MGIQITRKNNLQQSNIVHNEKLTFKQFMIRFLVAIIFSIFLMFLMAFINNLHADENSGFLVRFLTSAENIKDPIAEMQKEINESNEALLNEDEKHRVEIETKDKEISYYTSRGATDRKTKPLLDYSKLSCPRYLVELMERMACKHGFPSIATVYCIAKYESNFDPTCWNQKGEDSRGLLQVNVKDSYHAKRNPNKTKLFDPAYCLEYQLDELKVYYDKGKAQGLSGADLICYVSEKGQRCVFTNWVETTIRNAYKEYLNAVINE